MSILCLLQTTYVWLHGCGGGLALGAADVLLGWLGLPLHGAYPWNMVCLFGVHDISLLVLLRSPMTDSPYWC